MATYEDWALLGIEPTTDEDAIRSAYARALQSVDPESDTGGFQALQEAYQRILARQATDTGGAAPEPHEQELDSFLDQLAALRHAGDIDAAIAAIDRLSVNRPPGDPAPATIADALFQRVALQRSLSARLFGHLVTRFNWRDAQSPVARLNPHQHSVLLARVAAEDWYQGLLARAAQPGQRVAACAVARGGALPLPPEGLDKDQKAEARALLQSLWVYGDLLLERFDARSLAALRDALEGAPPPAVAAGTSAAQPASRPPPVSAGSPSQQVAVSKGVLGRSAAFLKRMAGFKH